MGTGLRVATDGLRVTGYGLRVTGYGLRVAGCGMRVSGYGLEDDSILANPQQIRIFIFMPFCAFFAAKSILGSGIGPPSLRQLSPVSGETQYEKT
jgi:hypothetical protein